MIVLVVYEVIPACALPAQPAARLQNREIQLDRELLIIVHTLTLLRRPCPPKASRGSIRPGPREEAHSASQDGEECYA